MQISPISVLLLIVVNIVMSIKICRIVYDSIVLTHIIIQLNDAQALDVVTLNNI